MKSIFKVILLGVIIFFAACKKSETVEDMAKGEVSIAEIKSVPPPTFKTYMRAYELVTTNDPNLLQDSIKLGRCIFEWVKAHPNGGRPANNIIGQKENGVSSLFDILDRLTYEEWVLSIYNPLNAYSVYKTIAPSGQKATVSFPCDSDVDFEDSKADALRHAFWNALMVRTTSLSFAEKIADAHESATTNEAAKKMDIHNNKIGRDLAVLYPTATEEQLLQLLLQRQFYFLDNPTATYPADAANVLVYFKGKRPYDGSMSGTLTNPDSGGPWNTVFYFNQCNNLVRGEFTIVRTGGQIQKRRFSGTISPSGVISISISDPYLFENPLGLQYCTNMSSTLNGSVSFLSGAWTSSNCTQGGFISLVR
jgi:hypothetical protein